MSALKQTVKCCRNTVWNGQEVTVSFALCTPAAPLTHSTQAAAIEGNTETCTVADVTLLSSFQLPICTTGRHHCQWCL